MNIQIFVLIVILATLAACGSGSSGAPADVTPPGSSEPPPIVLEIIDDSNALGMGFVAIPGDQVTASYEMSSTETTNAQYTIFLNEAYSAGYVTYDSDAQMVFNLAGEQMIWIGGSRVVKDHNEDGIFAVEEMENPLNRCFIEFDEVLQQFIVVDPSSVDWSIYFDQSVYPNVADSADNWAELNDDGNGWYGHGDIDKRLPTLDEVKTWPVNFIRYYGAVAFADFYDYDLPTMAQWRVAGSGGQSYQYATSDGTISEGTAWYNTLGVGNRNRGHVQGVRTIPANPYGAYSLGGNVWEWAKDWHNPNTGEFFIDETITDIRLDPTQPLSRDNQYRKASLGGSWNYFAETMSNTWDNSSMIAVGNDHFGFRVIKIE
jgi:formylglycine-generating enzyme required for sulfatase activity